MNEIAKNFPEIILGIICISAVIGALRFLFSQHFERKKIGLQKIELINNILKYNLNKPNARQKFSTEQAFSAVFGKVFTFDEIKAILQYKSPSKVLALYLEGRRFLKVSNSGKTFLLKEQYGKEKVFGINIYFQDIKFAFLYLLFSMLTIFPITIIHTTYTNSSWFESSLGLANMFWVLMSGLLTFALAVFAVVSMFQLGKIDDAFKLAKLNS
ncbi:hypothetical protein [Psychromonas sp. Urea-02u-13]|uniref:hypothetical protein n=1 Tax=Psychromonas sp. Urea-02u-13 TaxID=2058326 RepID=UPI000C345D6D|nr:hypothetical protein [Psychromonas sp. Urea-02u-13]PKG37076.1 hypothetical protein CXF74_20785 [Psychromonas sp. Urea-02u-13]